jgi:hypothetical protein
MPVGEHRSILSPWLPIGHTFGIFSVPGFLLVTRSEYSQSLLFYWSHVRNIPGPWLPIGHMFAFYTHQPRLDAETFDAYREAL